MTWLLGLYVIYVVARATILVIGEDDVKIAPELPLAEMTPEAISADIERLDRQKYISVGNARIYQGQVSMAWATSDTNSVMPVYCDAPTARCAYCGTLGCGVRCDSCGAPR